MGRSRILKVEFANERAGNIHALGNIENRYLTTINDHRDTASPGISIQGLADIVLKRCEQILIALLILRLGIFAFALVILLLLVQRVDPGLDLGRSCAARLL